MKNLSLILILILATVIEIFGQEKGTFIDLRDSKTYKTVKIGSQVWMAENLAYLTTGSQKHKAYNNDPSNVKKFGYLYDWQTASTACPTGWRLPNYQDIKNLKSQIGDRDAEMLKATSGWDGKNGVDKYGWAALPGGYFYQGTFKNKGDVGYWWLNTVSDDYGVPTPYHITMTSWQYFFDFNSEYDKQHMFSVRCIKQ